MKYIRRLDELRAEDISLVGGKNASLGELMQALPEVKVPKGFAVTAQGYLDFLDYNTLREKIRGALPNGQAIRKMIVEAKMLPELEQEIVEAYFGGDVAVRSSATAEDLPDASFAGQQETFLRINGKEALLKACKNCFASLFTDRAIEYREEKGFDHMEVALSIGIQEMVQSVSSGVMFTLDPDSGFPDVVVINSALGLGETVVQGSVDPDEYVVYKPLLDKPCVPIVERRCGVKRHKLVYSWFGKLKLKSTRKKERVACTLFNNDVLTLARWGVLIEKHYGRPMDIEWAKDGKTGELYIVQARPETAHSQKERGTFHFFELKEKKEPIISGLAIGEAIAAGKCQVIKKIEDIDTFEKGSILITEMTDPDWVPLMREAAGIITDHGGRTSHAAIVSRELGVPAIVGTSHATSLLTTGQEITLSCAEGDIGHVYPGRLHFEEKEIDVSTLPKPKTKLMLNLASPPGAYRWWRLPTEGVGLARMEFIISHSIKIHPMALIHPERVSRKDRALIEELTHGGDKKEYFIDTLAKGIAKLASSQYPHPAIVRLSDFKTNEYANLIGGEAFEPHEENPMLGFRGASRYYNEKYAAGFALECAAIKRAREEIGLTNIAVMVPFCRTVEEADKVLKVMESHGVKRGEIDIFIMAEIPSNIVLAEEFAELFDGFSIGSNDLTQLVLGIDRDSTELAPLFDEKNEAVKKMIAELISVAHSKGCTVGICGQAPSDYPEFAHFLIEEGIDSISLNPDSVIDHLLKQ